MGKENSSAAPDSQSENMTSEVMRRFVEAFQKRDAAAFVDLVAEDCIMESMQPAPNGQQVRGYQANVRFWQAMVTDPTRSFEVEDVFVCSDRTILRWRYRFGEGDEN